jgi:hypothetical protein
MMHSLFDEKMTHYFLVMVQMDELQSGPLMVKSLTGRRFTVELSLKYGWRTHACMWNNEMKINEVIGETILDG